MIYYIIVNAASRTVTHAGICEAHLIEQQAHADAQVVLPTEWLHQPDNLQVDGDGSVRVTATGERVAVLRLQ